MTDTSRSGNSPTEKSPSKSASPKLSPSASPRGPRSPAPESYFPSPGSASPSRRSAIYDCNGCDEEVSLPIMEKFEANRLSDPRNSLRVSKLQRLRPLQEMLRRSGSHNTFEAPASKVSFYRYPSQLGTVLLAGAPFSKTIHHFLVSWHRTCIAFTEFLKITGCRTFVVGIGRSSTEHASKED